MRNGPFSPAFSIVSWAWDSKPEPTSTLYALRLNGTGTVCR